MTDEGVGDVLRRFEASQNKEGGESYRGHVPRKFLVFVLVMIVVSVAAGVFIGIQSNRVMLDSIGEVYQVEDYRVVFTSPSTDPQMQGNNGYTHMGSDTIYISKELLIEEDYGQIRETCQHEILHAIGVSDKYHDRINMYEKDINDPVCNKLLNQIAY